MKKTVGKGLILVALMGTGIASGLTYTAPVYAEPVTTTSVNVTVEQQSAINWEKEDGADIIAVGIGLPPEGMGESGWPMARRAAVNDAQRNLAEIVNGVQIDSETTMENLVIKNDVVKSQVKAIVRGAKVIEEHKNPDGSYQVTMRIPLYGVQNSLAAAVIPSIAAPIPEPLPKVDVKATPLPQAEVVQVKQVRYTGVIVDASELGLEATFSPLIYDTNGRVVYGMKNIDQKYAISKGMVGYSRDLEAAASNSRAGSNPLIVKATAVKGGANSSNAVNVVVSVEDADKILLANENSGMLSQCAVVFIR